MKMHEILDLINFCKNIGNVKLPLKVAYKFNKLLKETEEDQTFYQEKFNELLNEYGKKDEDGNFVYTEDHSGIAIIDGKQSECNKKVAELQNLEVAIPSIRFTLDELDSLNFSVFELNCLMPLIED